MYEGHWFGGFMWLFWLALIGVIVWLVQVAASSRQGSDRCDLSPLQILERRFANGEIDEAEFERRRRVLNEPRQEEDS